LRSADSCFATIVSKYAGKISGGSVMSDNSPFLTLEQPCDVAVDWLTDRFSQSGLSVIRTFDLQVARDSQVICPCPHHGTEQCDCQMVVLLVYASTPQPVTIIAHGYNNRTWFSVVDTPQQRADPRLEAIIRRLIASLASPPIYLGNPVHAT
jgi:hypothetical protein